MEKPEAPEQLQNGDTASSTKFRPFSKFPPDLQLMVWEFAV
jgi:hypothetical protein